LPFVGVKASCTERKEMIMSNLPENENQQSEAETSEELSEFLLAELDASKQVIARLSDAQLEEAVGGKVSLSSIKNKFLGCFTCSGQPQTSEPVAWPSLPQSAFGPLGYAVGTHSIHTIPADTTHATPAGTSTGSQAWRPSLAPISENKRRK
jgi:hypothetical protein